MTEHRKLAPGSGAPIPDDHRSQTAVAEPRR